MEGNGSSHASSAGEIVALRIWPSTTLRFVNPGDDDGEATSAGDSEPDRRRQALDRMVEIADEAGMYERTASPKRTR